jgi:hypothetical protein
MVRHATLPTQAPSGVPDGITAFRKEGGFNDDRLIILGEHPGFRTSTMWWQFVK